MRKQMLGKQFYKVLRMLLVKFSSPVSLCPECEFSFAKIEERFGIIKAIEFPIDIVYTWVSGEQNEHALKRYLHSQTSGRFHDDGMIKGRFADNMELKYSLRSIQKFAPWVNRIFIITDRQKPEWLALNSGQVRLVSHEEIIPEQYLPTFNSHVIESYLHTIPDLSEHFIYFNDDFFLTRPCEKSTFFTHNGIPLIFTDWRKSRLSGYFEQKTPHACSFFNTLNLMNWDKSMQSPFIAAHGPYAQTKSNALRAFEYFSSQIAEFSKNKFRTNGEIAFYSHAAPLLSVYSKTAIPCDVEYYYLNIRRFDRNIYYDSLIKNKDKDLNKPLFICVNDTTISDSPGEITVKTDMANFLDKFYNAKSIFEI